MDKIIDIVILALISAFGFMILGSLNVPLWLATLVMAIVLLKMYLLLE